MNKYINQMLSEEKFEAHFCEKLEKNINYNADSSFSDYD